MSAPAGWDGRSVVAPGSAAEGGGAEGASGLPDRVDMNAVPCVRSMKTVPAYRMRRPATTKAGRFGCDGGWIYQGAFKCASASSRRRRRSALFGSSLSSQLR